MVASPPPQGTLAKLKTRFKETFFPDDPFRQFKGRPLATKWILAAQYVFPILQWAPNYSLSLFKSDLVSGLTIASLAIPQVLSNPYHHQSLNAPFLYMYVHISPYAYILNFSLLTKFVLAVRPVVRYVFRVSATRSWLICLPSLASVSICLLFN